MTNAVGPCGPNGCEPNCKSRSGGSLSCKELLACMDSMVNRDKRKFGNKGRHGLKKRFEEQINGQCGPGTDVFKTHDDQIKGAQEKLGRFGKTHRDKGCGSPPKDLMDWAKKSRPNNDNWKGNRNSKFPKDCNPQKVVVKEPVKIPAPSSDTVKKVGGALLFGAALLGTAALILTFPVTGTAAAAAVVVIAAGGTLNSPRGQAGGGPSA